jgi:hypothetical protein
LLDPLCRFLDWQAQTHEGLELDAGVLAGSAHQCRAGLALEQIHDDAFIPKQVVAPCFCCGDLVWLAQRHFDVFYIWFDCDPIEVFMQAIQQKR